MKVTIVFDTDNADFKDDLEGAIYHVLGDREAGHFAICGIVNGGGTSNSIRDRNGNSVGTVEVK
jgi:hypothetical protein